MLCESRFLKKYASVRYSVIARLRNSGGLFQSFLYAFPRGLALVRNSGVYVIARCPESRLYVEPSCANVDCHVIESLCHDLFIGHCLTAV